VAAFQTNKQTVTNKQANSVEYRPLRSETTKVGIRLTRYVQWTQLVHHMSKPCSSLDPVNLLSLCFGYCIPLVWWDCNKCQVIKVLKKV